jgi:hypothetical protein
VANRGHFPHSAKSAITTLDSCASQSLISALPPESGANHRDHETTDEAEEEEEKTD